MKISQSVLQFEICRVSLEIVCNNWRYLEDSHDKYIELFAAVITSILTEEFHETVAWNFDVASRNEYRIRNYTVGL